MFALIFDALFDWERGLVRVLLLEFLRRPEAGFALGGLPNGFDFGGGDCGGVVAEGVADVSEDGGCFLVAQKAAKLSHRNKTRIFFAANFYGAVKSVECEFDEPFGASVDPVGLGKGRKAGGGKSVAVGLVASDAMAVSLVDFGALIPEHFASGRKMNERGVGGLVCVCGRLGAFAGEIGFGGFIGVFHPAVDWFFAGFFEDAESVMVVEPRGGDDGFEANSSVVVLGGVKEKVGVVVKVAQVVSQGSHGGGADFVGVGAEQLAEEGSVDLVDAPSGPKPF